jgi:tetratricopeptide (TPR) repeat protein
MGVAFLFLTITSPVWGAKSKASLKTQGRYTGTQSCRPCHEKFYKLWSPSHHAKAMQAYSDHFAAQYLTPQKADITVASNKYRAFIGTGQGWVEETGPAKTTKLPIKYVLGGKNVFYFLTPMEQGKMQTLPVAYDVHQKKWFDTVASGVRHAGERPLDWRDASYTFNTTCRGCHVSQFSMNYNLEKNEYHTNWAEPGINCETCHGPGEAHIRVCEKAPKGTIPKDLKITRGGRDFTHDQNNATCSSCHAKAIPLTQSYKPGDQFWDHYDLVTLEHPDYYPDGRDLGENYTYTSWLMSPCVKSGKLDCLHCHTSSGRFRQKNDPNSSCLPCHGERVRFIGSHSHHKADPKAPTCVSCHMPMTRFARMKRSDHSMRPPTPAATINFHSPNACNGCHKDKDATWADQQVKKWHTKDYQAPILLRADLVQAARKRDWSRLPDILAYLNSKDQEEVFTASLIRLLRNCPDSSKWTAVVMAAASPSPLVRAAAIESLQTIPSRQTAFVLQEALSDPLRLVRIRAAQSLARYPRRLLKPEAMDNLQQATLEMLESYAARPDLWSAHYNIGNYYMDLGRPELALKAYSISLRLEPRAVHSLVNSALVYNQLGKKKKAESRLETALKIEPDNAPAHFNLGLLKANLKKHAQAEKHLRLALKHDPRMSQAAYNLGLLIFESSPLEGLELCRQAFNINPSPKYAYAIAQLLNINKDHSGAEKTLNMIMKRWPRYTLAYLMQAEMYSRRGLTGQAKNVLKKGMEMQGISVRDKLRLADKLDVLREPKHQKRRPQNSSAQP